jgi:hypothetical protein
MRRDRVFGGKTEIGRAAGNGADDIGALAFLDVETDIRVFAQENRQSLRQMFREAGGVGEQMNARSDAAAEGCDVALHHRDLMHDRPGVIAQAFTGGREFNAAASAPNQLYAEIGFKPLDPGACRCESEIGAGRTMGDAPGVRDGDKKLKIDQIKPHVRAFQIFMVRRRSRRLEP